jgi:hypothetical protein
MLKQKKPKRAFYRIRKCIGLVIPFPPLPGRFVFGLFTYFLKSAQLRRYYSSSHTFFFG